jgi:hypothetical protein
MSPTQLFTHMQSFNKALVHSDAKAGNQAITTHTPANIRNTGYSGCLPTVE